MNVNSGNLSDDDLLVEKLRRENFNQFDTLVRMHLSFVLDINTYENDELTHEKDKSKKRKLTPFVKKTKNVRGIMDGMPLTQEGICQVYQLVEFLKKDENIKVEGVFRRTGSLIRQQELKNLLNRGSPLNLENNTYSVHDCASVLKGFLAELPEPLLTNAHYYAHCQVANLFCSQNSTFDHQKVTYMIQLLILSLPSENRILLKDILDLLKFTASHEGENKMSYDNLSTVFTPHLVCPRSLSPEKLHETLHKHYKVISFMIDKSKEIFHVPPKLAIDVRAYYSEREHRKHLCPKRSFDESITDNVAANTVYSFVDVERTAKENQINTTETALAELYAHIQSLPESSKKKKLVRQFNKENGHGTPLQLLQTEDHETKGLSGSIKKYILENNIRRGIKNKYTPSLSTNEEVTSPFLGLTAKAKLFCTKCDISPDVSNDEKPPKKLKKSSLNTEDKCKNFDNQLQRSSSDPNLSIERREKLSNSYLTSTPAHALRCECASNVVFTPQDHERKSMSPITRSTQRMPKAMQESMMTPRSRKPVLLVSGTNIRSLPKLQLKDCTIDSIEEEMSFADSYTKLNIPRKSKSLENLEEVEENSLSDTFKEYLRSRSVLIDTPTKLNFSNCSDESYSSPNLNDNGLSSSLLHCLNGYNPEEPDLNEDQRTEIIKDCDGDNKLEIDSKQFDDNTKPVVYETSF